MLCLLPATPPICDTAINVWIQSEINFLPSKVPGSSTGEIFAKLEIYMWLGVTKYVKNCTAELPEEFKPLYESGQQTAARLPAHIPPSRLTRDGEYRLH